jgi:hypothetical protein
MKGAQLSTVAGTIIVHVPLRVRKRGGRKFLIVSDAPQSKRSKSRSDDAVLKALGRAYRWKRLLETGEFASIGDLAAAEKINHSYIRRILRLTLLSPEITEMILYGSLPRNVQLEDFGKQFSIEWAVQSDRFT